MEGVDLSPGMIEQARRKNLYDQLDIGDLTESLDVHSRADARFNLIVAADVFVYCADLTLIATHGRGRAAPKAGCSPSPSKPMMAAVSCSARNCDTRMASGMFVTRWSRWPDRVARWQPVSTRMEAGVPVPGLLVVAGRRVTLSRAPVTADPPLLPDIFARWFAARGWAPRAHQLDLLERARDGTFGAADRADRRRQDARRFSADAGRIERATATNPASSCPTGRELRRSQGLHTLYISPLKALAVDIARNLEAPVAEMGLPIRIETRTGDTPVSKRTRQRRDPPDILLTTPEQLALLLASADAPYLFGTLKRVVLDELHALVTSKRGDLLSLGLARLFRLAPGLQTIGLSATVADPDDLRRYLVPQPADGERLADLVIGESRRRAACHHAGAGRARSGSLHSLGRAFGAPCAAADLRPDRAPQDHAGLRQHPQPGRTDLPGTVAHQRDSVLRSRCITARSMSRSGARSRTRWRAAKLRAVVCTSSLDLGIDWGDVDLVINVGAPKGSSRLLQRIGRANHRLDEPSRGILVPANRFEVLECRAAIEAVAENAQDTPPLAHRRARRARAACARHRLRRAVRRRCLYMTRCGAPRPIAISPARISTTSSISSRPAAMR